MLILLTLPPHSPPPENHCLSPDLKGSWGPETPPSLLIFCSRRPPGGSLTSRCPLSVYLPSRSLKPRQGKTEAASPSAHRQDSSEARSPGGGTLLGACCLTSWALEHSPRSRRRPDFSAPSSSEAKITAKSWPGRLQRWDPSPPDPAPALGPAHLPSQPSPSCPAIPPAAPGRAARSSP